MHASYAELENCFNVLTLSLSSCSKSPNSKVIILNIINSCKANNTVVRTIAKGHCVLIPLWKENANTVVLVLYHRQQISTPEPLESLGGKSESHTSFL